MGESGQQLTELVRLHMSPPCVAANEVDGVAAPNHASGYGAGDGPRPMKLMLLTRLSR
jgi:hypothetical protein